MSAFLTFDSLAAATPDGSPLFSGLSLSIGAERVGLVGRNGSGKSTLLRIAAGEAAPHAGTVQRSGTIGMLAQDWAPDLVVAQALGVADALAILDRVLAGNGSAEDFDRADWELQSRIEVALAQVGLPGLPLDRRIGTLSGGERTRVGIARLLIAAPDLLLLDEPTNNLDAAGRSAIGDLVRNWRGGVLVASHDRALLDSMDRIVELSPIGIRIVGGGWSAFAAARDAERTQAAAELDRTANALDQARRAAQHQREAKDRRDKAGRAVAARGSEPKILLGARAERAENTGARSRRVSERLIDEAAAQAAVARAKVEVLTPLTMTLPPTGLPANTTLLSMAAASITLGDRTLGPWSLEITGPERVAIAGPNGAGKTTLLRLAAGLIAPADGSVSRAEGRIAMLDQHADRLDPQASILANLRRLDPTLDDNAAHAAAARFAFRNRDALRLVGTLSGGERLRAALAAAFAGERAPWLLILDEPTNHLDMESIEILEDALRAYDGALLVVSHDTAFLQAIGVDRILDLASGSFPQSNASPRTCSGVHGAT
ncbi:MAG TPA: ABC-F family ATP-binding cassette domain-containing protein [Sphingomonas sp.]|nr:ABC-F family ATP-binding cassette domain-containing protein [Sphingomonas sp.]